jgi:hypothetical protein
MVSKFFAATAVFLLALSLVVNLSLPGAIPRAMPDEALARIAGTDGDHRANGNLTDCSEAQSNMSGIPTSSCWNFDEVVEDEWCFFCTNDTLYPAVYPFGTSTSMHRTGITPVKAAAIRESAWIPMETGSTNVFNTSQMPSTFARER